LFDTDKLAALKSLSKLTRFILETDSSVTAAELSKVVILVSQSDLFAILTANNKAKEWAEVSEMMLTVLLNLEMIL
jgi:hypothetical protein